MTHEPSDRERLKRIMMDYADELASGGDPNPDEWADKLTAAIDRPAGVVKALDQSKLREAMEDLAGEFDFRFAVQDEIAWPQIARRISECLRSQGSKR